MQTDKGIDFVVDDETYLWAKDIDWKISAFGYISYRKGKDRIFLHRLVAKTPKNYITDHINGNKLDNLTSNLRVVTNKQNVWNNGLRKDNSSGYRGVYYRKDRGRWSTEIKVDGKKHCLGCYDSAEEAALVYNAKALEYFGEYARLNSIR